MEFEGSIKNQSRSIISARIHSFLKIQIRSEREGANNFFIFFQQSVLVIFFYREKKCVFFSGLGGFIPPPFLVVRPLKKNYKIYVRKQTEKKPLNFCTYNNSVIFCLKLLQLSIWNERIKLKGLKKEEIKKSVKSHFANIKYVSNQFSINKDNQVFRQKVKPTLSLYNVYIHTMYSIHTFNQTDLAYRRYRTNNRMNHMCVFRQNTIIHTHLDF